MINWSFSHKKTVLLFLFFLTFSGLYSYITIPKEANPDIAIPIVNIALNLQGVSPEDAERLLIRPIEEAVRDIEGIEEMSSTGFQGGGNVVLTFTAGINIDDAIDDVREKVDEAKTELPEDTDEPIISEVNFSLFPIISVILSGNMPERTLLHVAGQLKDEIESIPSVLKVDISGDRDEQVEMIVDPLVFESYRINFDALNIIDLNNQLVAAGSLESSTGRFDIKVPGLIENADQLLNMPLRSSNNAVLRVKDVATIRPTFKDPIGFARLNGQKAIGLEIIKRSGRNVIDTIKQVKYIVSEAQKTLPNNVHIHFVGDRSIYINRMLDDLGNNVISAILLVMIIVIAALGVRSGLMVGLAIPGSFLIGFFVLYASGLTVNIVVLFSLILSAGMLVDGAIVMVEFADRRMQEGYSPAESFKEAAKMMAAPITASTATTLAAFLPLLFWTGTTGEFMKFLPLTLMPTLGASLLMALVFLPIIGSYFVKAPDNIDESSAHQFDLDDYKDGITGWYLTILKKALRYPKQLVAAAFGMLVLVQITYALVGQGIEFFPDVEPDIAIVQVHARGNLSIYEQDDIVKNVEQRILAIASAKKEIESLYTSVGGNSQRDQAADIIGSIQLNFTDWYARRKANIILDEIIEETSDIPGIQITYAKEENGPPVGKPIQIELASRNKESLEPVLEALITQLKSIDGVKDIEDNRSLPGIEWKLNIDRGEAAKFNVNIQAIGNIIQFLTDGLRFTSYRPINSSEEVDIVARFPEKYRSLKQLELLRIPTDFGNIPISNFVTASPQALTSTIERVDGMRAFTLKADVIDGVLGNDVLLQIQEWVANNKDQLPSDVKISFGGENEEQEKSSAFLGKAFIVALILMALILITEFNSFYDCLLILSAVILSTIGVLIGLMLTGQPFGIIMSGVGVIALAGIVVNNNIVLIDTFKQNVKKLGDPMRAVLLTGAQRLRPVMLTTITTILGLIPMVLQMNIDFVTRDITIGAPSTQFWVQMSTGIAFGLAFATVLTLIVTPACLLLKETSFKRKSS